MSRTPLRDAFACVTDPFGCLIGSVPPWAWWAIAAFVGLILIGAIIKAARWAYSIGGWPALVGALGIIGTIIVVIAQALHRDKSSAPTPTAQSLPSTPIAPPATDEPTADASQRRKRIRDLFRKNG